MLLPGFQHEETQRKQNQKQRKEAELHQSSLLLTYYQWLLELILLVFKALNGLALAYICDLLTPYEPSRCLRSPNNSKNLDLWQQVTAFLCPRISGWYTHFL